MALTIGKYQFQTLSNFAVLQALVTSPYMSRVGYLAANAREVKIREEIGSLREFANKNLGTAPADNCIDMANELEDELNRILALPRREGEPAT